MKHKLIIVVLIFLGSVRAIADVVGYSNVSSFFSLLNVSPAMKVFTAHNNYETFSPRFMIDFHDRQDNITTIELTPELYRKLEGPYNRRNVFGAAISYAPVLAGNPKTIELFNSVARYSFCRRDTLVRELNLNVTGEINRVTIRYLHQHNTNIDYPNKLEVLCE